MKDQDIEAVRCTCGNKILQKSSSGHLTIRPRGPVRFDDNGCFFECHFCGANAQLNVKLVSKATSRLIFRK